jgi:hypothetical protein
MPHFLRVGHISWRPWVRRESGVARERSRFKRNESMKDKGSLKVISSNKE